MLITHFNQSHHLSKIQPIFLGKLTKLTVLQTTHITHTQYNNIPNAEGIKSVETSLGKYSKRTASTKVITTFLASILTLNNFIFKYRNYLQIKGKYANFHTQTSLWTTSKENSYTHLSRHLHLYTSGL